MSTLLVPQSNALASRILGPGLSGTHRGFIDSDWLPGRIWAPGLVFSGDLLARSLGPKNLATKIAYLTVIAAAIALLALWIRRLFTAK